MDLFYFPIGCVGSAAGFAHLPSFDQGCCMLMGCVCKRVGSQNALKECIGNLWCPMVSRRAVALILTARYSLGRRKPHYARRQSFKMYQSCINLPRSYQVVNTWFSRSWSMIRYNECPCCSARYGWGPHQQKHCQGNHYCALNSLKIKQNCMENHHCMIVWYSTIY